MLPECLVHEGVFRGLSFVFRGCLGCSKLYMYGRNGRMATEDKGKATEDTLPRSRSGGGSVPPFKPEAAFGRPERPLKPSLICYTITRRRAVSRGAGCCVHTTCFGGVACFLLHIRRPVAAFTHLYTRLHATSIDGIYTPWYNRGMERQYSQSPHRP